MRPDFLPCGVAKASVVDFPFFGVFAKALPLCDCARRVPDPGNLLPCPGPPACIDPLHLTGQGFPGGLSSIASLPVLIRATLVLPSTLAD